nr:hypothetical protein [uncultured Carboxylicivirga sp.]
MAHNLFLSMNTFKIKRKNTSNSETYKLNDFLSIAYPDINGNKFTEGFAQDLINLIDKERFVTKDNTQGAMLEKQKIDPSNRTLDLLIDGGTTGLRQFIIDEDGLKKISSDKDIIGPKWFARIWFPGGSSDTGYLFAQQYGGSSIKKLWQDLIIEGLNKYGFTTVGKRVHPTTTEKRLKKFLKESTIKDVIIVSKQSTHQISEADAVKATIKLGRISKKKNEPLELADIQIALANHGFHIENREYDINATYENKYIDYKEERTSKLDASGETTNLIPSIKIYQSCIDIDNYPIFEKMQEFINSEMIEIQKEIS